MPLIIFIAESCSKSGQNSRSDFGTGVGGKACWNFRNAAGSSSRMWGTRKNIKVAQIVSNGKYGFSNTAKLFQAYDL
jgi:hypothetical protein